MHSYLIPFLLMVGAFIMYLPAASFTIQAFKKMNEAEPTKLVVILKSKGKEKSAIKNCFIIGTVLSWAALIALILTLTNYV